MNKNIKNIIVNMFVMMFYWEYCEVIIKEKEYIFNNK